MTHYCKCLNVNIHLILEKEVDLTDHDERTQHMIENEKIRHVLTNELGFSRVKIGSSMAGVQCNINLLCTRDTLSYYKSIHEGTTLEDLEDEEEEGGENAETATNDSCKNDENGYHQHHHSLLLDSTFMNCQVISCQNCDMTCAFHVTDINRYYLNANMLHGSIVDSLRNSDQYSKVFGLIPQHTLAQEQTVNINIDAFPSLRKLQLHMQKSLMAEKTAMESRIEEFARKQRQQYMQFFKKTNTERTKVFLRAQHVIKYRRPDIQTRKENIDTPQDIHTPTGSEFDESLMFGSDLGSFSSTRDDTRKILDDVDEDSDFSDLDFDDDHEQRNKKHRHQKQQQKQKQKQQQQQQQQQQQMVITEQDNHNKSPLLISINSPNSPPNKFKQITGPPVAQSYKDLMSQSYFFRNVDTDKKVASAAMFTFDENAEDDLIDGGEEDDNDNSEEDNTIDDKSDDSDDDDDENSERAEDKPQQSIRADSSTQPIRENRPNAQQQQQHASLYSSSVPVQIPSRNAQYTDQQKQLQLQLALEKQKNKSKLRALRNSGDATAEEQINSEEDDSEEESSDEDNDEEFGRKRNQLPVSVSLAVNKQRQATNRTIRRRAEDDIFEAPQMSYIERYMTFRDNFFTKKS